MPTTMAICWKVTSMPREAGGATSAMYMGASIEAMRALKAQPMPGGMSVTQFKSMAQAKFDPDPQAAGQFKAMPKPPKSGRVSDFMQPGNPGKFKRNAKRNVKGA